MINRVGLLGGTFNPVHLGHIDFGLKIKEAFKLDLIRYILSAKPPHKDIDTITDSNLRLQMLDIALENQDGLISCDIELKREKPSYTIDTIKELKENFPTEEHYFIIGSDSFLKIETWKNYIDLLKMISFIVVFRKESHREKVINLLEKIDIKYDDSWFNGKKIAKRKINDKKVFFYSYHSDKLSFSSTIVREKIKNGENIKYLVNPDVIDIIKGNNLYGNK